MADDARRSTSMEAMPARRERPAVWTAMVLGVVGAVSVVNGTWWIVLIATAGVAAALLTLAQPIVGILGLLLVGPELTPYARISLPAGIPDLTVARLAVGLVAISLLVSFHLGLRTLRPMIDVEKAMLAFTVVVYIDLFARVGNVGSEGLQLFDEYAAPFLLFYVARNIFRSPADVRKFCYVMALTGLLLAGHGTYQYVVYGDGGGPVASASGVRSDTGHVESGRAAGPFDNAVEFGGVVSYAFLWTLFLVLHHGRRLHRLALLLVLAAIGAGAIFSLTRAVWLGLVLAVLTVAWLEKRWRFAIVVSLIGVALLGIGGVLILAPDSNRLEERTEAMDPIYMRVVVYRAALSMFMEKPLLGYGRGERRFVRERQDHLKPVFGVPAFWGNMLGPPHNIFLFTLIQWGLVGLVLFVAIFYHLMRRARSIANAYSETSLERRVAVFLVATTVVYIVQGMLSDCVTFLYLSIVYFVGAGVALAERKPRAPEALTPT